MISFIEMNSNSGASVAFNFSTSMSIVKSSLNSKSEVMSFQTVAGSQNFDRNVAQCNLSIILILFTIINLFTLFLHYIWYKRGLSHLDLTNVKNCDIVEGMSITLTNSNTYNSTSISSEQLDKACLVCGSDGLICTRFIRNFDEHGVFGHRDVSCLVCSAKWQEHYDLREVIMLSEGRSHVSA